MINEIIDSFNTRETSIILWFIILFGITGYKATKSNPQLFKEIVKIFFSLRIQLIFFFIILYSFSCVYVLHRFNLWTYFLLKDLIIFINIMFFRIIPVLGKNSSNTNVYDKLRSTFIDTFISINIIGLLMDMYTCSFWFEFLLIVPIGTFLGLRPLILDLENKNNKANNNSLELFLNYSSFIFFGIVVTASISRFIANPSKILSINEYSSIAFIIYLAIFSIPFLYSFSFFTIIEAHKTTMKYSLQKHAPNLNWMLLTRIKTRFSIRNLEIFTKIPYSERINIKTKNDLSLLIDNHLSNKLMFPVSHCLKNIILDKNSIEIILNDLFLKKEKIENEYFTIPYECFIEYIYENHNKGISLLKKIQDPLFSNKIKILSPFMENISNKKNDEKYLSNKTIQNLLNHSRKNLKTKIKDIYQSQINAIKEYHEINSIKIKIFNDSPENQITDSKNIFEKYKILIKKNKLLGVKSHPISKQNQYSLGYFWKTVIDSNFILGRLNTHQWNSISIQPKSDFSPDRWIKEIVFSSVLYGNSILSSNKEFCHHMVLLAEIHKLNIDIIYWNPQSNNSILCLNENRLTSQF